MTDNPNLLQSALAILVAVLYVTAAARQLLLLDNQRTQHQPRGLLYVALLAVSLHLVSVVMSWGAGNLDLGFYHVASLIFLTMGVLSLTTLLFRPLHMVLILTFPLAGLAVLLNAFAPATGRPLDGLQEGLLLHISFSLIAFGVLALATFQAVLVSMQTHRLKRHQTRGFIKMLPALDLMERMFWELMVLGVLLLTLAIVTGGLFIDDLFAQHLVHKTVLTLLAWLIYSVTLFTHWRSGLRINSAVTLAITGFTCMALGFFGSKLVLELIL